MGLDNGAFRSNTQLVDGWLFRFLNQNDTADAPAAGFWYDGSLAAPVTDYGGWAYHVESPRFGSGGARGDGTTDDSTNLAAVISAVPAGSVVLLRSGATYRITSTWTISKALTLIGYGATLQLDSNTAIPALQVTASNVNVLGVTVTGPAQSTLLEGQDGIFIEGAVGAYLSDVRLIDCKVSTFRDAGIVLRFAEDFEVRGCRVRDCYYTGIQALMVRFGTIAGNIVEDIDADGVVGTNAYGISVDKNNGSEAALPNSHHVVVSGNIIDTVPTWTGIDTHGGWDMVFSDNVLLNCRSGIKVQYYNATAGSEKSATRCVVRGNVVYVDPAVIPLTSVQYGILVAGDSASATRGYGNVVADNTVDGYSDSNDTLTANPGSIDCEYQDFLSVTGNIVQNSGRIALRFLSCTNMTVANNSVGTVSGTTAVAASGTITFASNPADGDTITINGRVYTFRDAPSGDFEIQRDGSTLATTLASATTKLNAATDGRVQLATYSNNATILTITHDSIGRNANGLFTIAASAATASAASLANGAAGSAGLHIERLSGASTGQVVGNTFSTGAYIACQMTDDNTGVTFADNVQLGTGPLYDLRGSSAIANSGATLIRGMRDVRASRDPASINAAASETFYIPAPGCNAGCYVSVGADRNLGGLVLSAVGGSDYVTVELFNPSAGAVNLGATNFFARIDQNNATATAV